MVKARRDFLDKGYYDLLRNKISDTVKKYSHDGCTILDAGCGECFYTADVSNVLKKNSINANILAIDVSKNALSSAKSRKAEISRAVASIFHIPAADNSVDILLNIFAPFCQSEFLRVLKTGGIFIQTIPLENHLWELKQAVYDKPYKNTVAEYKIDGFELVKCCEIRKNIMISSNDDVKNLFMMTPYYYKTSEKDFKKLDEIENLKVSTEFAVLGFMKI